MPSVGAVAGVAALIGEPARTAMLIALMDGRWLSAGELCRAAGIRPATGSGHLRQLTEGGLLAVHRQGRHRYFQLTGPDVAAMIERLMALTGSLDAASGRAPPRTGPRDGKLRYARICYDHLAGELGVAIADCMQERGELELKMDGGAITAAGSSLLAALGVAIPAVSQSDVRFCKPCLDWSVRRPHIGGVLGRALLDRFIAQGWLRKNAGTRALSLSPPGRTTLNQFFGEIPSPWN